MARQVTATLAKQLLRGRTVFSANRATTKSSDIPKGYLAVYVGGTEKKRFLVPISYLSQPSFQNLLCKAEEEYGFHHSMGGLTIPCPEYMLMDVVSSLSR